MRELNKIFSALTHSQVISYCPISIGGNKIMQRYPFQCLVVEYIMLRLPTVISFILTIIVLKIIT